MTAKMFGHNGSERTATGSDGVRVPGRFKVGDVVDHKFEILDRLGEGAMGGVYKVRHLILDKVAALKVLHAAGEYDDVYEQRFLDEARILGRTSNRNIVAVTDAGVTTDGFLYMAMELLEGDTLRQWMDRVSPEDKDEAYIDTLVCHLADISAALHELHRQRVIHRDLKPDNIVLHRQHEDEGESIVPKIIDFGIAKRLDDGKKRTVEGTVLGTIEYLAPEVQLGEPPDERSDVFSLGVILYQGLTGKRPEVVSREDLIFTKAEQRRSRLVSPSQINPKVTRALEAICKAALEPRPERRLQTALDFSRRLANLPSFAGVKSSPRRGPIQRMLKRPLLFGLALFALLVVSLLWFTRTPDELKTELPKSAGASFAVKAPAKVAQMLPSNPVRPPMPVKQPLLVAASNPAPTGESEKAVSAAARPEENHAATQKPARPEQPVEGETTKKLLAEGVAAFNARSYYEAEGAFEQVLRKTGDKRQIARAEFYLGRCAYQRGDVDEAISRARRALSRTDNPEWRIYLGMFHMTNEDQESAVREWMRVYCGTAVSGVLQDKVSGLLDDKDIPAGDRVCPKTGEP